MEENKKDNEKKETEEKGGYGKGILAGIGAALGIAALGIGGKMLYDKYKKEEEPEEDNKKQNLINKDTEKFMQKLRKQKNLTPKIITDEFDSNYIRANSIQNENEEKVLKIKNSFICPISQIMMENPVITPYGTTYEQSEILKWIEKNNNDYIIKKPLDKFMLIPNFILKSNMREYSENFK